MGSQENATGAGLTRRSALRTGAVVAGAAWSVPVLSVIGVSPAHADHASPVAGPTPPPPVPEQPEVLPTKVTQPQPGGGGAPAPGGAGPAPVAAPEARVLGSRVTTGAEELPRTGVEAGPAVATAAALIVGGAAIVKAASSPKVQADEE